MLEDTETIGMPPTPLFIPQEDTAGLGPALSDRYLLVWSSTEDETPLLYSKPPIPEPSFAEPPNFRSSPPNCTSNCVALSPGISTAELGIFDDGGILERDCVDETAAAADCCMLEDGAGTLEGGGAEVLCCERLIPAGPLGDPLLLGTCPEGLMLVNAEPWPT